MRSPGEWVKIRMKRGSKTPLNVGNSNITELGSWETTSDEGQEGAARGVEGKTGECDGLKIRWQKGFDKKVTNCAKWYWEVGWDEVWGLTLGLTRAVKYQWGNQDPEGPQQVAVRDQWQKMASARSCFGGPQGQLSKLGGDRGT